MNISIPTPRATGFMGELGLFLREQALTRKRREQAILDAEAASDPMLTIGGGGGRVDPNALNMAGTPYEAPMKTVGGSGRATVGGVTQAGGIGGGVTTADGKIVGSSSGNFGFDPYGSMDRVGNAKDAFGNVIMAPPAANSDPGMGMLGAPSRYPDMGSLDSYSAWKGGNSGASIPGETGAQARRRIWGMAKGGDVKEIQPYIVGEEGPELFVPETDGKIIPHDKTMELLKPEPRRTGGYVQGYRGPVGGRLRSYGSDRLPIEDLVELVEQILEKRGGQDPVSVAHGIAQKHTQPYQERQRAVEADVSRLPQELLPEGAAGLLPDTPENFEPVSLEQWLTQSRGRPVPVVGPGQPAVSQSTQAIIDDPNRPYTENLPMQEAERINRIYRDMGIRGEALRRQGLAEGKAAVADTLAQQADYYAYTHPVAPEGYSASSLVDRSMTSADGPYGSGFATPAAPGKPIRGTFGPGGATGGFQDWIAEQRKALRESNRRAATSS